MTSVDASTRNRRNRAVGQTAERDVARYLRPWWPDARRAVVNGWKTATQVSADPGDIDGLGGGIFVSVKNTAQERTTAWLDEVDAKRDGRLGLLIVKRRGHASPGEWWCWVTLLDLWLLLLGDDHGGVLLGDRDAPVRMELRHVMPLLVAANYAPAPRQVVAS